MVAAPFYIPRSSILPCHWQSLLCSKGFSLEARQGHAI
jgi:hypothetical protein